ncbi:MAG: hypothetical protein Q9227_001111 [Pyrenula ochraceoflavens]
MDPSSCSVVSLDVHQDDSTVLNLRVNNQWVHIEVQKEDLKNGTVRQRYQSLIDTHRRKEEVEENRLEDRSDNVGATSRDSGYTSDEDAKVRDAKSEATRSTDSKWDLQDWMIHSLDSVRSDLSSSKQHRRQQSLAEWYNAKCHCFNIRAKANSEDIVPVRRDDLDGEAYVRKHMTPRIALPKYLRGLKGVPWYEPHDLRVEEEADDIHLSAHPTLISVASQLIPAELRQENNTAYSTNGGRGSDKMRGTGRTTYFLKLATPRDLRAVKREIRFLHLMQKHDLYSKGIRAPRLAGLVSLPCSPSSKSSTSTNTPSQLLGFLLTLIPQPTTPLTHLMSPSVAEDQRSEHASQVHAMVEILHANKLIWGDAKADNFLVDGNGELWMIDFGGSYTPGWIDEELADTVDGDNMGTEKIVNGLQDPENAVEGADDTEGAGPDEDVLRARGVASKSQDRSVHVCAKRKRDEDTESVNSATEDSEEGGENGDENNDGRYIEPSMKKQKPNSL